MTPEKLDELERWFSSSPEVLDLIAAARREAALREALRQVDTEWVNGNISTLAYERIRALLSEVPQ